MQVAMLSDLKFSAETQCETQVLQLHEVQIPSGILGGPVEQLEKLLATPCLPMESDEQGLPLPFGLRAPRRRQDRLVYGGAQRVPSGKNDLIGHTCGACGVFERPDFVHG